jgi:hypothetical protein
MGLSTARGAIVRQKRPRTRERAFLTQLPERSTFGLVASVSSGVGSGVGWFFVLLRHGARHCGDCILRKPHEH